MKHRIYLRNYQREWRKKHPDYQRIYQRKRIAKMRKECIRRTKDYNRRNRKSYLKTKRIYRLKNRNKILAHQAVLRALYQGRLVRPNKCSECKKRVKVHAHHKDYEKPLEVVWLCRTCHTKQHWK